MNLVSAVCRPAGHKITYYPAEFKIAHENRYVGKICMNLASAVCRPVELKFLNNLILLKTGFTG
jgi:hypothetical protein